MDAKAPAAQPALRRLRGAPLRRARPVPRGRAGGLLFQWGQYHSTSDFGQTFDLHQPFASRCYALLTTCSRVDVRSALAVSSRGPSSFTINRDDTIDGSYPFYWIAIGDAGSPALTDPRQASLGADSTILWGDATSTSDDDQTFTTPVALGAGPSAALTTVVKADVRSALSLTSFDGPGRKLIVNRHNDIDGSVGFNYVGIGARTGATSTGIQRLGDFKLQWGSATSDSDQEQLFMLPEAFADMNFAVITTIASANHNQGLSLSRPVNARSFIVNRDASIDGARQFYWLAIGR